MKVDCGLRDATNFQMISGKRVISAENCTVLIPVFRQQYQVLDAPSARYDLATVERDIGLKIDAVVKRVAQ